eukprot:603085-Pelagomonas_calceolata.AAC.5
MPCTLDQNAIGWDLCTGLACLDDWLDLLYFAVLPRVAYSLHDKKKYPEMIWLVCHDYSSLAPVPAIGSYPHIESKRDG